MNEIKLDSSPRRTSLAIVHDLISEQNILRTLDKLQQDRSFIYSLEHVVVTSITNSLPLDSPQHKTPWIFRFHLRECSIYDQAGPLLIAVLVVLYPFCSLWTLNLDFFSISARILFPMICVISYWLVLFVFSNLACAWLATGVYKTVVRCMDISIRLHHRKPVTALELDRAIRKDLQHIGISLEPALRQNLKSIWSKMWFQKMKIAEIRPEFALQFLPVEDCFQTIETIKKPFFGCGWKIPRTFKHIHHYIYFLASNIFLISPLIWSRIGSQHQMWYFCALHSFVILCILMLVLFRDSINMNESLQARTQTYMLNLALDQLKHMEFPKVLYPQYSHPQTKFQLYLLQKYIKEIL